MEKQPNSLARVLRRGIVPGHRHFTSAEVQAALKNSHPGGPVVEMWGILSIRVFRRNGEIENLGVLSVKKVCEDFRDYIVDSLQDSTSYPLDIFKYHGCGTGTTAEASDDSALETEVETRATGSQTEGATANIFKTVGTIDMTGSHTIAEHGVFSASTNGTLLDRSVFSGSTIGVINGDSIEFTYEVTFNAES